MVSVSVAEARKRLSMLLGKVIFAREEVVITKRGRPVARLVGAEAGRWPADWKGWLNAGHPFFRTMDAIVSGRRRDKPRRIRL